MTIMMRHLLSPSWISKLYIWDRLDLAGCGSWLFFPPEIDRTTGSHWPMRFITISELPCRICVVTLARPQCGQQPATLDTAEIAAAVCILRWDRLGCEIGTTYYCCDDGERLRAQAMILPALPARVIDRCSEPLELVVWYNAATPAPTTKEPLILNTRPMTYRNLQFSVGHQHHVRHMAHVSSAGAWVASPGQLK